MMIRTFIFVCSFSLAFAALIKTVRFRDTWLKYYDGQQDHTIYAGAMISCQKRGGLLAMPKDKNFNDAVADVAQGQDVWIGLTDILGEGRYEWNDGDDVEWSNWRSGEPNNVGNEDCTLTNSQIKGKWDDRSCEFSLGFVCQIPDNIQLARENRKYTVYSRRNSTSYFQAKKFCVKRRSRLALLQKNDNLEEIITVMDGPSLTKYWVAMQENAGACTTVSRYGISSANCFQPLPVICEQVAPYGLKISEEEPTVEVGLNFAVDCTASGIPVPQVKWYRDGVYFRHQKRGTGQSSMKLENVTSEDAGIYVCKASNEVGGQRRLIEGYSFIGITIILG